ncbi:MAG: hybrid sensor histidine kinase/response regulator [Candidatus Omnitrophica bacterium]|nr:hybrid sensor histidine kinase/response regulator [Candidatus Omnitrophota bacterium]
MDKETNVLVLDDEVNILNSLVRAFRNEPYGLMTTSNPDEALDAVRQENIKVVISDQKMPKMDGVEFLTRVKEIRPEVVRILFTGYADIQIAEDAINKGSVYRFINKPWSDHELKNVLGDALKTFDLAAENRRLFELVRKQNEELEIRNEQLKQIIDKQTEFTTTVSHELQTPLASMRLAVEIMSDPSKAKEAQDIHPLNIIKTNVDRLWRVVNDVLDLSKLEAKAKTLPMKDVDLYAMVPEVVAIRKVEAGKKGISLEAHFDVPSRQANINVDKINQVLHNLIGNAIKFTEKGKVEVVCNVITEQGNSQIQICVKDTGRGIASEDMGRLFEKFQQFGDSGQRVSGTGLGLAICREIITQHNGKIWAESKLGEGSAFIFTLPLASIKVQSF